MGRVPGGRSKIWEVEEVRSWTPGTELAEVRLEFRGVVERRWTVP